MLRNRSLIRFSVLAAVAAFSIIPALAFAQDLYDNRGPKLQPYTLTFRNTTAASAVVHATSHLWTTRADYTDSTVFRHASALPFSYDTTISYPLSLFGLPPHVGPGYVPSVADTLYPWFFVKIGQDTLSSYSGSSAIVTAADTFRVWVELSNDNINWYTASGTPTYRFDVLFATTGQDGLQSPTLIGVERVPGQDFAVIPFHAQLNLSNGARAQILNALDLGVFSYCRFIFGGDYIGQFKAEILRWAVVP